MEAELKANYPDSHIKLIPGSGGIFDIRIDGKLFFSKQMINGNRFPNDGEITQIIKQEMD